MSKKQIILIILVTVIVSWLLNLFFGRQLTAKISTLPVLNRWHILSPEAPIVINNQQTVRVAGGVDMAAVASAVKSKISAVILVNNGSAQITGSALNLTSDGNFVTGISSMAQTSGTYYIQLNDGRSSKVKAQVLDSATSLVFLKTDLSGVPVTNLGNSQSVYPGDVLIFASASFQNYIDKIIPGSVVSAQGDIQGQVFQSDYPRRSFNAVASAGLLSGDAIFNSNSDTVGLWDGKEIISSDVLKQALNLYLDNNQKISRPSYGFSYQNITPQESALTGQPSGVLVKSVTANSPAHSSGLMAGDIITSINGAPISYTLTFEEVLQSYKPGDQIDLRLMRAKNNLTLKLTVGALN